MPDLTLTCQPVAPRGPLDAPRYQVRWTVDMRGQPPYRGRGLVRLSERYGCEPCRSWEPGDVKAAASLKLLAACLSEIGAKIL